MAALAAGAVDVIAKASREQAMHLVARRLCQQVKAASQSQRVSSNELPTAIVRQTLSRPPNVAAILIGSSTGGVEALRYILPRLPEGLPPIIVVQHIPAGFSRGMAKNLNEMCAFPVREAEDGELLSVNTCLVAPGDFHLSFASDLKGRRTRLSRTPPVNHCRPAIDITFRSAAETFGAKAVGAILTGMGADGARGMSLMRARGAHTLAHDEATSVVFGMPRAAIALGAAEQIVSLTDMPRALVSAA
jgi:two-component system chemotaxis response regulator CheB